MLEDRDLKKALAVYFAEVELNLLIQNTHELELVETFQPYIIDNLNYMAVADIGQIDIPFPAPESDSSILDVVHTRTFRNIVTQKWVIVSDLLAQNQTLLSANGSILDALNAVLSGAGE